jgi:hypothetical protein
VNFVRYADDVVAHCTSGTEAEEVLEATKRRLAEVKLQIKEEKRWQELHSIYSRNKPNQPEANTGSNQRGKTLNESSGSGKSTRLVIGNQRQNSIR